MTFAPDRPTPEGASTVNDLPVLMTVRLKGRVTAAAVAAATGRSETACAATLAELLGAELVSGGPNHRITPAGKDALAALLAAERAEVDQAALTACYDEFHRVNDALKVVVTAWQLTDPDTPNDHTDAAYDAGVIERLGLLDSHFAPVLSRAIELVPRLAPYRGRFANALAQIAAGDTTFVARPITDSYHTVWFEFHEELIGLLGRTRLEEAAAGRAL